MPPKKKVDPEQLQQQFEQWKETNEYKKWEEMSEGLKKFYPVTETTLDINGPWQEYFDELMKFFQVMKVKTGKIKEIRHEMIRSFFFAREEKENDKVIIDGMACGVVKEHADRAWTLRHKFCDILKAFSDIEDIDYENFQTNKKNLQKTIAEFFKYYNPHVKSGHKEIYETKIFKVLEPLNNLIQINALFQQDFLSFFSARYFMKRFFLSFHSTFNRKYKSEQDKEVQLSKTLRIDFHTNHFNKQIRSFKVKALCEKYCQAYAVVLRVLDEESKDYKLIAKHDLKRVFYKLSYKGWANNPCEKLYLQPLNNNFLAMQKELMQMYALGINFWKIPLAQNEEFLSELENLIRSEIVSERLLGNPLKRELFNFVYKVVQIIKEASPFLEANMLKKDENTVSGSIPKLVIFKMVQHMYQWKEKKADFEKFNEEKMHRLQMIGKMKDDTQTSHSLVKPTNSTNASQTNAAFLNSSLRRDKVLEPSGELKQMTNDNSILNASLLNNSLVMNTSSSSSSLNHTSTQSKILKEMSLTLPVQIPLKTTTNKQEIFNFAEEIETKIDDPVLEFDTLTFGRYFYLEGFINPDKMPIFEKCVELIRNLNPAVQQDIEDSIILHGITPKVNNRHDQTRVQARLQLEKLQEHDFSNVAVNSIRPPELWNYPDAIGKHAFRSIAKPKDCYIDGRFEEFDEKIEILTQNLTSYKPESWREIISRVIDVFADNYNKAITPINPAENF